MEAEELGVSSLVLRGRGAAVRENQGWSRGLCGRIKGETSGGVCLLSFDLGLNLGGAGPGPLFALFNTQYPSPCLFLSLHPSLAAFTCTMSAQPSETPVDRSDLSAE